jgi:hypothetical protein
VPSSFESFKDGKELFVMDIVVEFSGGEGLRKKCNRLNFSVSIDNGENCCKCIIGGVSLHNKQSIRLPM